MESEQVFWFVALALTVAASVACARKGIQPNPLYRTATRLAAGGGEVSAFASTTASCVGLVASLLFGVLAYYVCLRSMCTFKLPTTPH
tara:strand:+ start:1609 stop:1872 length:264 start_codon:yes stop_codon:yes gene_type:complete